MLLVFSFVVFCIVQSHGMMLDVFADKDRHGKVSFSLHFVAVFGDFDFCVVQWNFRTFFCSIGFKK